MQSSTRRTAFPHLQALERAWDGESGPDVADPSAVPASSPQRNNHDDGRLPLSIRLAKVTDLADIGRIERILPLAQPRLSVSGYSPTTALLTGRFPRAREKPVLIVAETHGDLIGFADFRPKLPDRRWQLFALGASTGVYDPAPIWEDILANAVRQAGLQGVKRLYASAPPQSTAMDALKAAGFAPYASETIFVADAPHTLGAESVMREQESSDTWAIHQLYNASVPRDVLYAEALTSHAWDIEHSRRPGAVHTCGWIVEDGGTLRAYVRVTSDGGVHSIEVTFPPGSVKSAAALIDAVLRRLRLERRMRRVYITVRSYQQELEPALSRMDFRPGLTQDLLVRYTAVPIRAVSLEASTQHVEIGDRVPAQAPSILTVVPHDGVHD